MNRTTGGVVPNDYNIRWNYQTFSGCSGSETTEPLNPDDKCVLMFVENTTDNEIEYTYKNCVGEPRTSTLEPNSAENICGLYGSFKGDGLKFCPEIIDQYSCFECVCIGYTVTNNSPFGVNMTVNWIGCNGLPQTSTLAPDSGFSLCACEGSVTTEGGLPTIFVVGPCV
jgi:hypothetical protein